MPLVVRLGGAFWADIGSALWALNAGSGRNPNRRNAKSLAHTACEQGYCVQASSTGLEPATIGSTVRKIRVLVDYLISSYGNRQTSLHQRLHQQTQKVSKARRFES